MFAKIAVVAMLLSFAFFATAAVFIQQAGFLVVDVRNNAKDEHVFIPFPMILANAAFTFIPDTKRAELRTQIGAHSEIFRAAGKELMQCPDGPFVEVETPTERVWIAKAGRNIVVDVKSDNDEVHLQIPIESTLKAMAQLTTTD